MSEDEFKGYGKTVFLSKESETEWENLDVCTKKLIKSNIRRTTDQLENKMAIQVLANIINDMQKEIDELKKKQE